MLPNMVSFFILCLISVSRLPLVSIKVKYPSLTSHCLGPILSLKGDELLFKSHLFNKYISEIFSLCFALGMLLFICLKFGLGFLDVFSVTQGEYLLVTSSNLGCLFSCKPHK